MVTAEVRARVLAAARARYAGKAHGGNRPGAGRAAGPPAEPCRDCGTVAGFRPDVGGPATRIPVARLEPGVAGVLCWGCVRRRLRALTAPAPPRRPPPPPRRPERFHAKGDTPPRRRGMRLEVLDATFLESELSPAAAAKVAVRQYDRATQRRPGP